MYALWVASTLVASAPPPTDGGTVVMELVNRALEAKHLRIVRDETTGKPVMDAKLQAPRFAIVDAERLRAMVRADKDQLHVKARQFLVGLAKLSEIDGASTWIALLRMVGEETNDPLFVELAAHISAQRGLPRQTPAGMTALKELVRLAVEAKVLQVHPRAKDMPSSLSTPNAAKLVTLLRENRDKLSTDAIDTAVAVSINGINHAVLLEAIGEATNDRRAKAFGVYFRAQHLRRADRLEEAAEAYHRAAASFVAMHETPWQAQALRFLAMAQVGLGDLENLRENLRKSLTILQKVHKEPHIDLALVYYDLAKLHKDRHQHQQALYYIVKGYPVLEPLSRDGATDALALGAAFIHLNASIQKHFGDHAEALTNFEHALLLFTKLYGEKSNQVAVCLADIGNLHVALGNKEKARTYLTRALKLRRGLYPENHPEIGMALLGLAFVAALQEKYEEALGYQQEAARMMEAHYGKRHPRVALAYQNIGHNYLLRHDEDNALAWFRRSLDALAVPVRDASAPVAYRPNREVVFLLNHCGELEMRAALRHQDKKDRRDGLLASLRSLRQAADVLEQVLAQQVGEGDKIHAGEGVHFGFVHRIAVCRELHQLDGKTEHLTEAYVAAEQGRARALLELVGDATAQTLGRAPAHLLDEEQRILVRLRRLDRMMVDAITGSLEEATARSQKLWQEYGKLSNQLADVRERMRKASPAYAAIRPPGPSTLAQVRQCLRPSETAVLFALGPNDSFAIVLAPRSDKDDGTPHIYRLPPDQVLAARVTALTRRPTLESLDQAREQGAAAFQQILQPLAERLRGRDLVIVPDGVLCHLPFELLAEPGPDGQDCFLAETRRIRYAPSLTVLHQLHLRDRARPRAEKAFWGMGDPIYDKQDPRFMGVDPGLIERPLGPMPRLAGSGDEVRVLAGLFNAEDRRVLTDAQATEAAVKSGSANNDLKGYRFLHFAVHGFLGGTEARLPGLALGRRKDDGEDGYLELDEVANLRLNSDLVVLSACESGRGRLHEGEGVRGLAQIFLTTGSRGVVCSLWKVHEKPTMAFMVDFYRALRAGSNPPDALRLARRAQIDADRPPLHWGAFLLVGGNEND